MKATMPDTGQVTDFLLNQGVLGFVCLMLIVAIIYLVRRLDATQKRLDEVKDRERERLLKEVDYFNRIRSGGGDA